MMSDRDELIGRPAAAARGAPRAGGDARPDEAATGRVTRTRRHRRRHRPDLAAPVPGFLGRSPQAVLRDIRFEAARRELLQGSPDTKVMDVALRCGLPHLGRFSVEYRRRYGETPSQTLKRQAMLSGTLATMTSMFDPAATDRAWRWSRSTPAPSTASPRAASPTNWRPR